MNLKLLEPLYLASPFTHYPRGHVGAYLDICRLAADFHLRYRVVIFSPIAHCHGMTTHGKLPAVNHRFWEEFNRPFVAACGGCVVATLDGWEESAGVTGEIKDFRAADKPVLYLDCATLDLEAA